ncbi:MAG: hypothetical protein H8E32_01885 [Nitrospinae bacterium]|nr:hypothetical protein [Nitrospinota bacterium]
MPERQLQRMAHWSRCYAASMAAGMQKGKSIEEVQLDASQDAFKALENFDKAFPLA